MDRAEISERLLKLLYSDPSIEVAIDTETTGLRVDDGRDTAIGLSLAFRVPSTGRMVKAYWGINHRYGQNIDAKTLAQLRYVLVKQARPLIFANVQFDVMALLSVGIDVTRNPMWDVLTMMNLVAEEWTPGRRGLDELAVYWDVAPKIHDWEFTRQEERTRRVKVGTATKVLKSGPRKGQEVEYNVLGDETYYVPRERSTLKWQKEHGWPHTTPDMIYDYAAQDAETTYLVWECIVEMEEWRELPSEVWEHKQELVLEVLIPMRMRGIAIDEELTAELLAEGEAEKERVKGELGLNPASYNDAYELWINRLKMPILKVSEKTGKPSFDKTVIAQYEELLENTEGEEAELVRCYQGWKTACGLLFEPYLKLVSPDGRLRTSYTTHQTVTGRLSSREPNLQQISKDGGKPWNNRVKKCFRAKPGFVLLSFDYSQLELRIGTAYSQEPELLTIFAEGRDIFTEMTTLLKAQFERAGEHRLAEEWTRQKTKTLVYSIQYGGGVKRVMTAFTMSAKQAKAVIDNFYRTYRRFRALNDLISKKVEDTLRARIWSGRYRHFKHKSASYKGMNSVIQGGAADVVERIMVRAMREIDNEDCRMLLQVHDALVFEVREDLVDEYTERILELMQDVNGTCDPDSEELLFPVTFAVECSVW